MEEKIARAIKFQARRSTMQDFEKLGMFYLGKTVDPDSRKLTDELLLYESRDLTTHAVCVGMTGSGKTGLCISLLEEAAIDGIPAIAIDPKGDLGNLLLSFPGLQPGDFRPWVDETEASRQDLSADQYAAKMADIWRNGLKDWDQEPSRIQRFRDAVDIAIYTPGSQSGLPVSILRSFDAPPTQILADPTALRERILGAVSGLLGLLNIEADPIRSREHILLSTILDSEWRQGKNLDIPTLIQHIQKPPFQKVGVFDLESFFPGKDRFELAILLNNLLASPSFSAWMEGDPLDIQRFLYTPQGKPRLSIFSIAHLNDVERMFFMTMLLNEMLSWMRRQEGTSSLRAILYIDEIFGYFPPTANPPSKIPMLTLLKQARAFGLGVVLSTQNPVDLDYKGLANTGTWFVGRLQTERDRDRLIDGLLSLETSGQKTFDRARLVQIISGLGKRVFLMQNVHESQPVLLHTRWALSYLRGPLTLMQIKSLTPGRAAAALPSTPQPIQTPVPPPAEIPSQKRVGQKPPLSPDIEEYFIRLSQEIPGGGGLYQPCFLSANQLHFIDAKTKLDIWETQVFIAPFSEGGDEIQWEQGKFYDQQNIKLETAAIPGAHFAPLPSGATQPRNYNTWKKMLQSHLYQQARVELFHHRPLKMTSQSGEPQGDFTARVVQALREQRDEQIEKLRQKYGSKISTLTDRVRRAEERVGREKSQMSQQTMQTAISVGATILGAILGRKAVSAGSVGRATTAMRGAGRVAREKKDIDRAQKNLQVARQKLADLEAELQEEVIDLQQSADFTHPEIEKLQVSPRKSDIVIKKIGMTWVA